MLSFWYYLLFFLIHLAIHHPVIHTILIFTIGGFLYGSINLSKILCGLLIALLPDSWLILIAVDETLERRKGKKLKQRGIIVMRLGLASQPL